MQTRALVASAPGVVGVRPVEIDLPGPGEVLVEIAYSCMSPGTENRVLSGKQAGAPQFPFIVGYSAAGVIVAAGAGQEDRIGERVFCPGTSRADIECCWGGHSAHAVLPGRRAITLPEGVSLRDASAAKLAAIAYQGLKLARPLPHERVVVIGMGPIGFFSALHFRAAGADVYVVDLMENRRAAALAAGLELVDPSREGFADIVVDATGAPGALVSAVRFARPAPWDGLDHAGARLVIQGSYAAPPLLPYDEIFAREVRVLVPRDNSLADIADVLDLMARQRISCQLVLGDFGAPENAAECYAMGTKSASATGCFRWTP